MHSEDNHLVGTAEEFDQLHLKIQQMFTNAGLTIGALVIRENEPDMMFTLPMPARSPDDVVFPVFPVFPEGPEGPVVPVVCKDSGDSGLRVQALQDTCASRSARWHDTKDKEWTVLEIAGAMCGEAGEAANMAKKLRRHDLGMQRVGQGNLKKDRSALVYGLGMELADTIIYLCALATNEGIDLEKMIQVKFNKVSEDEGFPERL